MSITAPFARKQSERRYFRSSDCDCRDCFEQDRRSARVIAAALSITIAVGLIAYAIVRSI